MNKTKWDALPDDQKTALTESVRAFSRSQVAALSEKDEAALVEARANPDITVHDWSDEERAKFRTIAVSQWEAVAEQSENARLVYDALTTYLTDQGMMAE